EKRGRVIVVEEHEHVGLPLREPGFDRLIAAEKRTPVGIVLLIAVVGAADRGDVRGADAAEDFCHGRNSEGMMGLARRNGKRARTRLPRGRAGYIVTFRARITPVRAGRAVS